MATLPEALCSQGSKHTSSSMTSRLVRLRPSALGLDFDSDGETSTQAPSSDRQGLQSTCTTPFQASPLPTTRQLSATSQAAQDGRRNRELFALEPPAGVSLPLELTSHGSVLHHVGKCKPCAWFHKPQGCAKGQECSHCHLCAEGEFYARRAAKRGARRGSQLPACCTVEDQCLVASEAPRGERLVPQPALAFPMSAPGPTSRRAALSLASALGQASLTLPSVGSALHISGDCKPCAFFHRPEGCHNGRACTFCHTCPAGAVKDRKQLKRSAQRASGLLTRPDETLGHAHTAPRISGGQELGDETMLLRGPALPQAPLVLERPPTHSVELSPLLDVAPLTLHRVSSMLQGSDANNPYALPALFRPPPGLALPSPTHRADLNPATMSDQPSQTLPIIGSALHGSGGCKPCAFLHCPAGCQNGSDCTHCHGSHACPADQRKAWRFKKASEVNHGRSSMEHEIGEARGDSKAVPQRLVLQLDGFLLSDDRSPMAAEPAGIDTALPQAKLGSPGTNLAPVLVEISNLVR